MDSIATAVEFQPCVQELTNEELQLVSGGVIPLAVAVYYAGGFASGVVAGWVVGSALFRVTSKCS